MNRSQLCFFHVISAFAGTISIRSVVSSIMTQWEKRAHRQNQPANEHNVSITSYLTLGITLGSNLSTQYSPDVAGGVDSTFQQVYAPLQSLSFSFKSS
ncbi:hypothetical protein BS50DRAFT_76744 [Corynespora cassiicola Philippines]|uniref:Uncharacterized protein n=1 Tax=Corynespora cassiicola Philippines TaxID=1448308 RepID=A0A2T2NGM5_CORCC|nr:hypothetical protein BS50DRAFT_76744 [Corynespora cassiicola Philippines]